MNTQNKLEQAGIFVVFLLIFIILIFLYPDIPHGFFTDEVKIGLTGWEFAHLDFSNFRFPFFYRHNDQYLFGALPPLSVSPVVLLFGLSEFTVRAAGSLYAFLGLCAAYATMRLLKFRYALLAVVIFLTTPIFYHLSRVQFGQTPSFFLIQLCLLLYYYLVITKSKRWFVYVVIGILAGIGCYGYSAYLLQIPLFMATWMTVEVLTSVNRWEIFKRAAIMGMSLCIVYTGVGYAGLTFPDFFTRLHEKQSNSQKTSVVQKIIQKYPKYYSPSYLFESGEIGQPGAFITRHSVTGSGIIYTPFIALFLGCVGGIIFLWRKREITPQYRLVVTSIIWIFLTPLADILSTSPQGPPYTISVYVVCFGLVYVLGFGIESIVHIPSRMGLRNRYIPIVLVFLTMSLLHMDVVRFFRNYRLYPQVSSDYWGWQWGPRDLIEYFRSQSHMYDNMYIEAVFNDPSSFIPFYTVEKPCPKCQLGNTDLYDSRKNQLFAVSPNSYNNMTNTSTFKMVKVFRYPNNVDAFYVISKK